MFDIEKIIKMIDEKRETSTVDFKREFYKSLKNSDLPKDVVAFANSRMHEDRYIIFGVDDDTREIVGIDVDSLPTQDAIDDYIDYVIEPFANVVINSFSYEDKHLAYLKVLSSNQNPPYIIKETCGKNNKLEKGDIYIRKGTCNVRASRADIDEMYANNGKIDIKIHEKYVGIAPIYTLKDEPTYGSINVEIFNDTTRPILIDGGEIHISRGDCQLFCQIVSILPNDIIKEHPLEIVAQSRKVYTVLFDFLSQDCVALGFNEDGFLDETVTVKLTLVDTDNCEYTTNCTEVVMHAKGNILHKVRHLKSTQKTF